MCVPAGVTVAAPSAPVQVYDEKLQYWVIYPDDPAWRYVRVLWMKGVRMIGLPRQTILGGDLTDPKVPATITKWDVQKPETAAMVQRLIRLRDIVGWLRQHPPED